MRLRVVSWNLDSGATGRLDAKVALLHELRPDLALLQELSRPVYRTLLPHPLVAERLHEQPRHFSWGALSTDLCRPRASDHRLGCAVLGSWATMLLGARLLDTAPFCVDAPRRAALLQRTVAATVALPGGRTLTACSFHDRPPLRGRAAPELASVFDGGITAWLAEMPGSVVLGVDSGTLALTRADLGPSPAPHGDRIWATSEVAVCNVRYLCEEALAAGSDHALVLADVEI